MTTPLIQQYEYERKTWNRLLDYLQEDNIQYKDRITEILKNKISTALLGNIEIFLDKFIMED